MDEGVLRQMIRVLYVHHAGVFGGASRSLLEMINAFPEGAVQPYVIVQKGGVAELLQKMGIPHIKTRGVSQFDNTQYGYYRGARWLLLLREFAYAPLTLLALLRAKRMWSQIDVIHVNEVTMLLPIVLAKLIFRKPVVVHIRSVQRMKGGFSAWLVKCVLKNFSDCRIAIDDTVKASAAGLVDVVIHNGFALRDSVGDDDAGDETPLADLPKASIKVAMVGNVLPFKGSYEFIEAAKLCKQRGLNVDFIIVGGSSRVLKGISGFLLKKFGFAKDVMADIRRYVHEHGLDDCVHVYPPTPNIKPYYAGIDILCFPSYLNAVGRPVFEAAFSKVPSIVAIDNPKADTIVDRKTGYCIAPKSSSEIANAIEYFCLQPKEIRRMGDEAYQLAMKNFDIKKNAIQIVEIYNEVLDAS